MTRWMVNGVAGISLVMCVALCVLWARSYFRSDALRFAKVIEKGEQPWRVRSLMIYSGKGCVEVAVGKDAFYLPERGTIEERWFYRGEDRPVHPGSDGDGIVRQFAGFGMIVDERGSPPLLSVPLMGKLFVTARQTHWTEMFRGMWAPDWFLVLVFGVMPGRRIYRWMKIRRRQKRGLCEGCGYDLRESGERCPERGEALLQNCRGASATG